MRRLSIALAVLLPLLGFGLPALASTVQALDLEQLLRASDEVFVGEATAAEVHYDDRGRIVTDVRVRIAESLAGERRAGEEVVLRCLGGSLDGLGMRVAGEAQLAVGERALLFTRRSDGGWLRTVGMSQGLMPMAATDSGWIVEPGGAGLALVRRGADGRLTTTHGALTEALSLAHMRTRLSALRAAGAVH